MWHDPSVEEKGGLPIIAFADQEAFESWIATNSDADGVWVKLGKKANPAASITYAEALDVALCYGWIDGQKYRYDELWFLQRFTLRRKKSMWSQVNRGHIERLTEAGRMRSDGLAAVEAAKVDGRWDAAYASSSKIEVPDDLATALALRPTAEEFFGQLKRGDRYSFLARLAMVKRAETRKRKIVEYVEMLERGETLH